MKKIVFTLISIVAIYWGSNAQVISASYDVAQSTPISPGTVNAPVLKIKIVIGQNAVFVDSLLLTVTCCTNYMNDVSDAKLFYTGNSGIFSTSMQYGNSKTFLGSSCFTGTMLLNQGIHYFWLTYSISPVAVSTHLVGARCDTIYFESGIIAAPDDETSGNPCTMIFNTVSLPEQNQYFNCPFSILNDPESIIISSCSNAGYDFNVFDLFGRKMISGRCGLNQTEIINVSGFAKGTYFIRLNQSGNNFQFKFFIK